MKLIVRCWLAPLAGVSIALCAHAGPWIAPGDPAVRHDVQLLADRGLFRGPVTTWPMGWAELSHALQNLPADLSPAERAAAGRLRRRLAREFRPAELRYEVRAAAAAEPRHLRTFENTPREEGELSGAAEWTGRRFAWRVEATAVAGPDDDRSARLDGSYAGVSLGNWMVSANAVDRWWGPGWEGSLIYSNNARPIPGLTIERNRPHAFETPWLSWLGPWSVVVHFGQLESDRHVPDARFFGMRVVFRPTRGFELGLVRTAQWCGSGRPCGLDPFGDLLLGNDNQGLNLAAADEPGNQLAGLDWRWSFALAGRPLAFYGQFIGEDAAGYTPSAVFGQLGFETWGPWRRDGSWRLHVEISDTLAAYYDDAKYGTTYNHGIYRTGYRYRGRVIGHSMDNDSRMVSVGLLLVNDHGSWNVTARVADLNRDGSGGSNTVSPNADQDYYNLALSRRQPLGRGELYWGAGWERYENATAGTSEDDARVFVQWYRGF